MELEDYYFEEKNILHYLFSGLLSPYHTGQLCRQFVRLFCWPTDLEHPHARRSVVIEALYPIITTNHLLPA